MLERNTATISGGGETVTSNDLASDPTNIVQPGIDLGAALAPAQIFTSQGATGVTYTATVVNIGSVASSGTVTLAATLGSGFTATAISGTGWSCTLGTLTCTRSDSLGSSLSYPAVTVTFNVALNAPLIVSSVGVNVSGGGDATLTNNSPSITAEIGPVMSIFSNTPSVTVAAGVPAKYQVGVSATAAAGTVSFTCSGLPSASTCTFLPPSITNTSVFVIMTVNTTARTAVLTKTPGPSGPNPWFLLGMLSLAAMAGWTVKLCFASRRPRRLVPILAPAVGACALVLAAILAGCGGGGGGGTTTVVTTNQGTPAGTYTITFTATGPVGSNSRTMTLVVQ